MLNNKKLVNKLTKSVRKLEKNIEHRKLYNIRNFVIRTLLKSGIAIDYAFPFICAAIIGAYYTASDDNTPFYFDEITEKAKIETIDTSSGIHIEHVSYDFDYEDELIEHSTGWHINDKGLYERTITSYRLNDKIDLEETEKIMNMTKEELEQILVITNVRTIKKNILTPEDSIYNEDAIIVINHKESETETITRLEESSRNFLGTILYIIIVLCWGTNFRSMEQIFIKTYLRDRLRKYEPMFRQINKDELETMKKIIELKKENLALIKGKTTDETTGHSYSLRRINGGD